MKLQFRLWLLSVLWLLGIISYGDIAWAQATIKNPDIVIESFDGTYHLSRDANNRSLLTTDEVVLADFPAQGNYIGITREIPKSYQGRNVEIKILKVTDVAGNTIPYKTSTKGNNLVVTIGNPKINLYGSQTFKLSYQTKGVINITSTTNEFLLNVNGRGWNQSIDKVRANIYIPKTFDFNLTSMPSCYVGYNHQTLNNCGLSTKNRGSEQLISVKNITQLAANQGLVVKLNFKTSTFSNKKDFWSSGKIALVSTVVITASLGSFWLFRRKFS